MRRNRRSRLVTNLCLAVLLAGITAPVFASPPAEPPPSAVALWRTLTGWLDALVDAFGSAEANLIPYPDPLGNTGTNSASGEANLIPFADPYGKTGTNSASGEANLIPYPDPAGNTGTNNASGEANLIPHADPHG